MSGLIILLGGVLTFLIGAGISMNTSTGGTRSDHDDGSNVVMGIGAFLGIVGTLIAVIGLFAA